MSKTLRPYDVTDTEQFLQMESDNHPQDPSQCSILHCGEHVSIFAPFAEQAIQIPRDQFNAIVDWYIKPQKLTEPDHV